MGVSGQRHAPAALYPRRQDLPVPIVQEAGWAPAWIQATGKILSPLPGIEPDRPVVQPVVRHYTDWATPGSPFKTFIPLKVSVLIHLHLKKEVLLPEHRSRLGWFPATCILLTLGTESWRPCSVCPSPNECALRLTGTVRVARGEGVRPLGWVCVCVLGWMEAGELRWNSQGHRKGGCSIDFMYAIVERIIRVLF
jgi:hypothetical protein